MWQAGGDLSEEADYLLASEAANAGKIILSHADEATEEQIAGTIGHLNRALEQIHCGRRLVQEIVKKSIPELSEADFAKLSEAGYVSENYRKMDIGEHKGFDSLYFMNLELTAQPARADGQKNYGGT